MSASLVGSEMCIRDSLPPLIQTLNLQRMPKPLPQLPAPPMVMDQTAPAETVLAHQTTLSAAAVENADVHITREPE
eukprot:10058222-Alexandrium_andersonii.AAC.1